MVQTAEYMAEKAYITGKERELKQLRMTFKNRLNVADNADSVLNAALNICKALLAAKKAQRNGIWAYILANTYAPVLLKNSFDLILGNPPWLVFRDISSKDYQNELKELARRTGVMPKSENLFTHLELAAIFVGHCLNYFLKSDGKLAFVMPRSIFVADQHHKMREGTIQYFKPAELWDLAKVTPLFNIPSCVLFCSKGNKLEEALEKIPGKIFSASLPKRNADKKSILEKLKIEDNVFYLTRLNDRTAWSDKNINISGASFYLDKFRQGATLVPRSLCFVDIDQPISGELKDRLLRVKSSQAIYREAKEPWKSISISGTIHSKFLFETALANNIVPFGLNGSFLVALPLLYKDSAFPELCLAEALEELGELESAAFFGLAEQKWNEYKTERNRNTSFESYLNWQNKLKLQNLSKRYIVLYTRAGTNAVSTIVDRANFQLKFIIDNISYFFSTNILEEALYLNAYLNSNIPNQLIKPFQTQGLFGARDIHKKILEIPFPEFDAKNKLHMELVELARKAEVKVKSFLQEQNFDRQGGNMTASASGKFRKVVKALIAKELEEIDKVITKLCGFESRSAAKQAQQGL